MDPTHLWEMIVKDITDLNNPAFKEPDCADIRRTIVDNLRDLAAWIDRGGFLPNINR